MFYFTTLLPGSPFLTLILLSLSLYFVATTISGSGRYGKPVPGPRGWPLIGSILDIIKAGQEKRIHLLLEGWAREFGDVVLVRSGPTVEYYVNSRRAAKALMDTNASLSSERPRWVVSNEHICGESNLLYLPAQSRWKVRFYRILNDTVRSLQPFNRINEGSRI